MGPLQDIRVLDLSRLLPGPFCTRMFADMGADVIKVEEPMKGDYSRDFVPRRGDFACWCMEVNRNKKSVALDLKQEKDRDIFMELAKTAHVVVESYRPGVMEKACELKDILQAAGVRVRVDATDKSPGFKFAEQEMRGIPVRIEIGPKDLEAGQGVVVRRDNRAKEIVSFDELAVRIPQILDQEQQDMFERARAHRDAHIFDAVTREEFKDTADNKPGFIRAMWCGETACEEAIKEEIGVTSRCIPFTQEHLADNCVFCGKPAAKMVFWGKAY